MKNSHVNGDEPGKWMATDALRGSIPGKRDFSLRHHSARICFEVHTVSYPIGTGGPFVCSKPAGA